MFWIIKDLLQRPNNNGLNEVRGGCSEVGPEATLIPMQSATLNAISLSCDTARQTTPSRTLLATCNDNRKGSSLGRRMSYSFLRQMCCVTRHLFLRRTRGLMENIDRLRPYLFVSLSAYGKSLSVRESYITFMTESEILILQQQNVDI